MPFCPSILATLLPASPASPSSFLRFAPTLSRRRRQHRDLRQHFYANFRHIARCNIVFALKRRNLAYTLCKYGSRTVQCVHTASGKIKAQPPLSTWSGQVETESRTVWWFAERDTIGRWSSRIISDYVQRNDYGGSSSCCEEAGNGLLQARDVVAAAAAKGLRGNQAEPLQRYDTSRWKPIETLEGLKMHRRARRESLASAPLIFILKQ